MAGRARTGELLNVGEIGVDGDTGIPVWERFVRECMAAGENEVSYLRNSRRERFVNTMLVVSQSSMPVRMGKLGFERCGIMTEGGPSWAGQSRSFAGSITVDGVKLWVGVRNGWDGSEDNIRGASHGGASWGSEK